MRDVTPGARLLAALALTTMLLAFGVANHMDVAQRRAMAQDDSRGGVQDVLERIRLDVAAGRTETARHGLRWVLSAEPANETARELAAQLGMAVPPLEPEARAPAPPVDFDPGWERMAGPAAKAWWRARVPGGWIVATDAGQALLVQCGDVAWVASGR